jgi:hypothetical protein
MTRIQVSIILAEIISTCHAHPAKPASLMGFSGNPIPDFHPPDGTADLDNLSGPFVADHRRIRFRPQAFENPFDDLRIGPADGHSLYSSKDFVLCGLRGID